MAELRFQDVQDAFDDAMLLTDRNVVRLLAATTIANQLPEGAPVWLMLVASSSSGKTSLLMTLDDLEFVPGKKVTHFISDLTENTLASGFKVQGGDASLLNQVPFGGIMIFKDFTSLLTKRTDSRDAIMGQLREVYDRKFDKKTGNNQDVAWKGKLGAIAGVTTAVHEYMAHMSVMGDRFIMYTPLQPDRMKLLRFIMAMKVEGASQEKKLERARILMHSYLKECVARLNNAKLFMREEDREHLMYVADFATKVRSGVIVDERKGYVKFVPEPEMPTRLIEQLVAIGTVLSHMRETDGVNPELDSVDMGILYKIAFDSIPIKRRWALRSLAKYQRGVTTAGLGVAIGYETEVVREWLAQLSALGVCRRLKSGNADLWVLNEEYQDIMETFEGVQATDSVLEDGSISEDDMLANAALRDYEDLAAEFDD